MSQQIEGPRKGFAASAALAAYLRVVLNGSAQLVLAGATDHELGITWSASSAQGQEIPVHLRTAQGTVKMTTSGAVSANAVVYADSSGKITATPNSNPIGIALEASSGNGQIIEVLRANDLVDLANPVNGVATGYKIARGQQTTVAAADTIVTGLATVVAVVATEDSDPTDNPEWVSATIGDQAGSPAAGSFILKTWQNTSGTDPTPVAATTFGKKVNWLAIGT